MLSCSSLLTADLDNNNTEFVWWVGWGGGGQGSRKWAPWAPLVTDKLRFDGQFLSEITYILAGKGVLWWKQATYDRNSCYSHWVHVEIVCGRYRLSVTENCHQILQGLGVGPGSATERWPSRKIARKWPIFLRKKNYLNFFFFCIHLLVMPKYWGKQIFRHGRFPEVGEK